MLKLFFLLGTLTAHANGTLPMRFALLEKNIVAVQGVPDGGSLIRQVCGESAANCACEFQDTAGKVLGVTTSAQLRYDSENNFFRCEFNGAIGTLGFVRVFGPAVTSAVLPVQTSITLSELLGPGFDMNRVRTISRYSCEASYLQKHGTTSQSFDCSIPNPDILCDTGNFCLLRAQFPFHLYSDNFSNNFSQKMADRLYNAGSGRGRICGLQIKQYDCVGFNSFPTREFGLYADPKGYWNTSVALQSAPEMPAAQYGFAAKASLVTGTCAPGLVPRIFYTATIDTSNIVPSHNFATGQVATEVADPNLSPGNFRIQKVGGGNCNGASCTLPISLSSTDVLNGTLSYSSKGQTVFCVIPPALLPQ